MKILKFNETITYKEPGYKEYDEYANINSDILRNWKNELESINEYISDLSHDLHRYNDFIREYVLFDSYKMIIANRIELSYSDKSFTIYFYDDETKKSIHLKNIKDIRSISEIALSDEIMFLELYNTYIEQHKANYMDIFGRDEFKHILDTLKYNI